MNRLGLSAAALLHLQIHTYCDHSQLARFGGFNENVTRTQTYDQWLHGMRALSRFPSVFCKLSMLTHVFHVRACLCVLNTTSTQPPAHFPSRVLFVLAHTHLAWRRVRLVARQK